MESDVQILVFARTRWEKCEAQWCEVRHRHKIELFYTIINSNAYTMPEERDQVWSDMRKEKNERHDKERVYLLTQLGELLLPNKLEEKAVESIKILLDELHKKEEEANQRYFEKL